MAKRVVPSTRWPERPREGQRSAVALDEGSPLLARIEAALQRRTPPTRYERWHFGPYVILSGIDATQLTADTLGAEPLIGRDSLPAAPRAPDGFN